MLQVKQDKHFLNKEIYHIQGDQCIYVIMLRWKTTVLSSDISLRSSFKLIILILFCDSLLLMKEITGRHFWSHSPGNTLYTASCTDNWFDVY